MAAPAIPFQPSFDDLGTPLHAVTFVVVDLETTGGSPQDSRVTEIGAVKVRCGDVIGEFHSLVDPGVPIPTSISALTGITDGLVAGWPSMEAVLPTFLEFCRGATLVAHNARFDTGFLNAGLARLDYPRLANPVVCTAALARRLVRDEVRNCKLATLARHFRCRTEPIHRALADAQATVEVLHALLERAGSFGVLTLEDLIAFARVRNAPLFKARRSLADGLPSAPGVYRFRSASGEILYVGKATDLRARVRSYFGSDDRRKIVDLLKESAAVDHVVCPTPLEASVREVRAIHAHRPRFNRRSKHPDREVYVKLTSERYPRLSIVRAPRHDGAAYLGPLASRRVAQLVVDALHEAAPIRRCTDRIGATTRFAPCALAEMGRCLAPCDGRITPEAYRATSDRVRTVLTGAPDTAFHALEERMRVLAGQARFEEAATSRDRMRTLGEALARSGRRRWLTAAEELVAARPGRAGRREVVLVRAGRLVATATCGPGEVGEAARALRASGDDERAHMPSSEELDLVARWLEGDRVRIVATAGEVTCPVEGGRRLSAALSSLRTARGSSSDGTALAEKRRRRSG